jgi:hypothetical protein
MIISVVLYFRESLFPKMFSNYFDLQIPFYKYLGPPLYPLANNYTNNDTFSSNVLISNYCS